MENLPFSEPVIRMSFFFGILIAVAVWEMAAPRRTLTRSKPVRWISNLGIVALNSFVVRLLFPTAAVGLAVMADEQNWGLLNNFTIPYELAVLASVIALDFLIYLQHVMVHAVPALWRLHRMHHADQDYDVTTGARFHPVEIILSMVIKFAAIVSLGPPALAVLIFEILLNGTAMFNHANAKLPLGLDRVLRLLVVTPDMHRVHHSIRPEETNSNFGFSLPWWDRLFGTYRDQPEGGHDGMTIGIDQFREPEDQYLHNMLWQPFRSGKGGYAINRENAAHLSRERQDHEQAD